MNQMINLQVNRAVIEQDFPGCQVVSVEEYYKPGDGLLTVLPDGNYCFDTDLSVDDAIKAVARNGATTVTLKIITKKNKTVFQDYYIKSLIS